MLKIREWSGVKAVDSDGKEYLDFSSGGIFCCGFGPDLGPIRERFLKEFNEMPFFHCYSHRFGNYYQERYREALERFTGFDSFAVFTSGAEAVEAALRVAWCYTGRPNVWGGLIDPRESGTDKPKADQFHGWTLGARILAGRMTWRELGIFPELGEKRFGQGSDTTALMAMEPYHAPSATWHRVEPTIRRIVGLQKEFVDIVFLIDEIQGGFGRTGKLFAYQHYEDELGFPLKPNLVTVGKLAGAGFPVAVLCGRKNLMEAEDVIKGAELHSTHSWNPVSCLIGSIVIEEMERMKLVERAAELGLLIARRFGEYPVSTTCMGLLGAVELADEKEADRVVDLCRERGLLVIQTGRRWVKIGPALIIEEADLMRGLEILGEVLVEVRK